MRRSALVAIALTMGISCKSPGSPPSPSPSAPQAPEASAAPTGPVTESAKATKDAGPPTSLPWQTRFDFDGDGAPDRVEVDFTGGGHCCYHVAVALSRGPRVALPFEIDGGYVGGLDLSRPDHFNVVTRPDGRAELRMEIATYNGKPEPIPAEWGQRYGVRSHRIAVTIDAAGFHGADLGQ